MNTPWNRPIPSEYVNQEGIERMNKILEQAYKDPAYRAELEEYLKRKEKEWSGNLAGKWTYYR